MRKMKPAPTDHPQNRMLGYHDYDVRVPMPSSTIVGNDLNAEVPQNFRVKDGEFATTPWFIHSPEGSNSQEFHIGAWVCTLR